MNKKGFTLVEIIVAVSLLLAITVMAVPAILNISEKNKTKEYNGYVDSFIAGAKLYATDQNYDTSNNCANFSGNRTVTLQTLVDGEYINENIPNNPLTSNEFGVNSIITISCSSGNLSYSFTAS